MKALWKEVKEKVISGNTKHGCKNILSITKLYCSFSDSYSRITIYFKTAKNKQEIILSNCTPKDWQRSFTWTSKEGNDL